MKLEFYSVSQPGPKEQQDAVAAAVLPRALVFSVVDGISHYAETSAKLAPHWARKLVDLIAERRPGAAPIQPASLIELMKAAHIRLRSGPGEEKGGLAAVLVVLTADGACHYACSGDVALWARKVRANEWIRLSNRKAHTPDGNLEFFMGTPLEGEEVVYGGTLANVEAVVAMTDGFYEPAKASRTGSDDWEHDAARKDDWCPRDPPLLSQYYTEDIATALNYVTPRESNDNYSALYAKLERTVEASVPEEPEAAPTTGLKVAMWLAVGLGVLSLIFLGLSMRQHPPAVQPAVEAPTHAATVSP